MTQSANGAARPTLGIRSGNSRKLLARKAVETAAEPAEGAPVEDAFPPADEAVVQEGAPAEQPQSPADEVNSLPVSAAAAAASPAADAAQEPASAPLEPAPPAAALPPAAVPAWSSEDESSFQAMAAQRKAAGYQRRGRDVGDQVLQLGAIKPNPNTVVAAIVGIVAERGGSVARAELIAAMAGVAFPHAKAQPTDKDWCQGYVAGAIRNGFLALADSASAAIAA